MGITYTITEENIKTDDVIYIYQNENFDLYTSSWTYEGSSIESGIIGGAMYPSIYKDDNQVLSIDGITFILIHDWSGASVWTANGAFEQIGTYKLTKGYAMLTRRGWVIFSGGNLYITVLEGSVSNIRIKSSSGWQEGKAYVKLSSGWQESSDVYVKTSSGWQKGS